MSVIIDHIKKNITFNPNESIRLFHGRGKFYPEATFVNIDYFSSVIVIYVYKEVNQDWLHSLVMDLLALPFLKANVDCVVAQIRYLKGTPFQTLFGKLPKISTALENGLSFLLRFGGVQNIGFFPDMKNVRQYLLNNACNKTVLNLFAYTCSLSVAAAKGNASSIVNVDMSNISLNIGKKNHHLNKLCTKNTHFFPHDIFKSWGKIKRNGPYDIIVIDPPFLQAGSFNLRTDYQKIISRLHQWSRNGTEVIATLNYPYLPGQYLIDLFSEFAEDFIFQERMELPTPFLERKIEEGLKILRFKR